MKLSVIIPTHNRCTSLFRTLEQLEQQTLSRSKFEVIVVDDGSKEEGRRRIRAHHVPFEMRLVEKSQGGLASARNRGAEQARGEILHFLDDDVLAARETLEQHVQSHEEHEYPVAVVGSLPYPSHVKMTPFLWYLDAAGHYDLYSNPRKYPEGRPPMAPMNGNSSVRRDKFFEIGAYDEGFAQYGSEDLDLGYRLQQAGVKFVYNSRAIGYHDHVKDFARFCVDMETAGESLIGLYRKFPEIKVPKKIDLVEDRFSELPPNKKLTRIVMSTTFALPWMLGPLRWFLNHSDALYPLRRALFPFYRLVSHYHYAVGMRRGLELTP